MPPAEVKGAGSEASSRISGVFVVGRVVINSGSSIVIGGSSAEGGQFSDEAHNARYLGLRPGNRRVHRHYD